VILVSPYLCRIQPPSPVQPCTVCFPLRRQFCEGSPSGSSIKLNPPLPNLPSNSRPEETLSSVKPQQTFVLGSRSAPHGLPLPRASLIFNIPLILGSFLPRRPLGLSCLFGEYYTYDVPVCNEMHSSLADSYPLWFSLPSRRHWPPIYFLRWCVYKSRPFS